MEIIDIFYNDILKEAMDGKVDCYFSFNIHFYNNLMTEIRESIDNGCFAEYKKNMLESMAAGPQD